MILPLLLFAAGQTAGPPDPAEARYRHCIALVRSGTDAALAEAMRWQQSGGGHLAEQCAGLAEAAQGHWPQAAGDFEAAARAAAIARDTRIGSYWAQAGNAWLAAGEPAKARAALDAALAAGTLTGLQRGEAQLDTARALVATGDLKSGRAMLDQALVGAAADPLAWLLSATLARRMDDLPRASKDIAEALARSADDASVQLEAGNIAALSHDETGARRAWQQAVRIAPDSSQGRAAATALRQFDASGTGRPGGTMIGR
jgi:tetratricopeptide (TPR) repeat protein